jgi:hypothetical protein
LFSWIPFTFSPKPEWVEEEVIVDSLDKGKMFFVNRAHAVERLQEIHNMKYERAKTTSGMEWIIPIADNVIGLGKSEFGRHYIQKCRETWPDSSRTDFQKTLCACHTVSITFRKGALLNNDRFDTIMLQRFRIALATMFKEDPDIVPNPPNTTDSFLELFTEEFGPLFIVLDEIGAAFEDDQLSDIQSREKFFSFCRNVLGKWLSLKNVFFLLLGRGSFLSYVGLRPVDVNLMKSRYVFQRLNIHLLRPLAIEEIIKRTLVSENGTETLQRYLNLSDKQVVSVAGELYRKTNGHPRSLIQAFKACESYEEISNYEVPFDSVSFNTLFFDHLFHYKRVLGDMILQMDSGEIVDLTANASDIGGKQLTLDIIANNSFISWEGNVMAARLYTLPFVKDMLRGILLPFRKYLECIGNISDVSVDFANAFEWMALKRFQEIFSSKDNRLPSEVLPLFFDTPIFGKCPVSFSTNTRLMPKITTNSNKHASVSLDSLTAHPEKWKELLPLIEDLGEICIKPMPASSSSDCFLFANAVYKRKEVKLTLGLAVKNYSRSSKFSLSNLDKECLLFNRMFIGATNFNDRLNILVIVCTSYDANIAAEFKEKNYLVRKVSANYRSIHEVILLNLSKPDQRANFFGISSNLSALIEKIIRKDEAEHNAVDLEKP